MREEFWLNTDEGDIRDHLRRNNWDIYEKIFKISKKEHSGIGCFPCVSTPKREYVNPYVKLDFTIGGKTVTERVFMCLGRHETSRQIVQYYVSEEYNVNVKRKKTEDFEPTYITGRFIFARDRIDHEWILFEMAEESAIVTKTDLSYEKLYLKYRKKRKIGEEVSSVK